MEGDKDASIMLVARLADDRLHHCRAIRNRIAGNRQVFQVSLSPVAADGQRTYATKQFACEATSGRLRLARRGNEVFYLLADGDSPNFRLFGKEVVSTADTLPGGVDLSAVANGSSTTSVVWKNLRIAAEELLVPADPNERPTNVLFVINADGTGLKQITESPQSQSHGSPDWSPDGKLIAFDVAGGSSASRIFLVNADGTGMKDLGPGMMPTFSPDGRRLAFTWSGQGMAIMDIDGGNRQVVSNEGWGAQWSPDGRWIAYETRQAVAGKVHANITIIDVKSKQKRLVLENNHAARYSQIYWNMEWSPDSRGICFKGDLSVPITGASSEVAIINVGGSSQGFQVLTTAHLQTDFSWHPDGGSILVTMSSPQHRGNRLFVCDPKTGSLSLLAAQPLEQNNVSGVFSPDGRRIAFSSHREPQPQPWRPPPRQ
jgi:Tol biopolymer transport system component